ncbi:hypothetical protein [Halovivax limisalsi]|uniref:hypothetical protein n=1 Tax=Halovivax limisalsi TaxID=1453760 RepID=UPI001FFC3287|nr:hypothetical protein [Halovivax limisalsi]
MDLPAADRRCLDERRDALEEDLDRIVSALLAEIPHEPLREQVELLAFTPNDALPKRRRRPKWEVAFLVDGLARAFGVDGQPRDTVLGFSLCINEYYDIFDDVVDGDVADGARGEVVATWQVMFPLCARLVHRLGDDAVEYWTELGMGLMEAPLAGVLTDPGLDPYLEIVERQGDLFGFLTGLCAVLGDEPTPTVERAERIGRSFFAFEQFLLDGEQYGGGETEGWNLFALAGTNEAIDRLVERRIAYERACRILPEHQQSTLTSLVAVDLDRWRETVLDGGDRPDGASGSS